jgi:3-hydroxyisobutyrate dehydrogenase
LAAQQMARVCRSGTFVLELNSASPHTKTACAKAAERAGGRYVEAVVMSLAPPHVIRVPMLLGGRHAAVLHSTVAKLGFAATV